MGSASNRARIGATVGPTTCPSPSRCQTTPSTSPVTSTDPCDVVSCIISRTSLGTWITFLRTWPNRGATLLNVHRRRGRAVRDREQAPISGGQCAARRRGALRLAACLGEAAILEKTNDQPEPRTVPSSSESEGAAIEISRGPAETCFAVLVGEVDVRAGVVREEGNRRPNMSLPFRAPAIPEVPHAVHVLRAVAQGRILDDAAVEVICGAPDTLPGSASHDPKCEY
jgi:hypothetical protein